MGVRQTADVELVEELAAIATAAVVPLRALSEGDAARVTELQSRVGQAASHAIVSGPIVGVDR
jgi:hypothetical protein